MYCFKKVSNGVTLWNEHLVSRRRILTKYYLFLYLFVDIPKVAIYGLSKINALTLSIYINNLLTDNCTKSDYESFDYMKNKLIIFRIN